MFDRIKNTDGFTLIELMMVMIILGILIQISTMFALDIRKRAFDATALADGKNLMTIAGNSFIGLDDVNFAATSPIGSQLQIGVQDTGGGTRPPVFTLSPGVRAIIYGVSPGIPGGGDVSAYVYNIYGTDDPGAFNPDKKREFYFSINEITSSITAPTL